MERRNFTAALVGASAAGVLGRSGSAASATNGVGENEAALGIRTALEQGALAAVGLLGRSGGFLDNPAVRIPLPGSLENASRLLAATGQQRRVDELVVAMNRAAEAAMPEAKSLLVAAVKAMSVEDAHSIVAGGDDSATRFFAVKTREPLATRFLPIVTRATQKVALADRYNAVAGRAAGLGLLRQDDANIERYVTGKALDGVYTTIGEQERQIRQNPVATGSAILRRVFGR